MKLVIFLLVLVISDIALTKDVYLNISATSTCTEQSPTRCYFNDATLWNDFSPPSTNDSVYMLNPPQLITLIYTSILQLSNITLQGQITLQFEGTSQLNVHGVFVSGSSLILSGESSIVCDGVTTFINGTMHIAGPGGYAQYGDQFMFMGSVLNVVIGYIGIHSAQAVIQGRVATLNNANFVSTTTNMLFSGGEFEFSSTPTIYNAFFLDSIAIFRRGWRLAKTVELSLDSNVTLYSSNVTYEVFDSFSVDESSILYIRGITSCTFTSSSIRGALYISSSSVAISGTQSFSAPLTMAGDSDFTVSSLTINSISFANGEMGEKPNIYLITENLNVVGNVVIPQGDIQFSKSATFSGNFNMTSGAVSGDGPMQVEGVFAVGGIVRIGINPLDTNTPSKTESTSSLTLLGSSFVANVIYIGSYATLSVNQSTIYSNVELFYNSTLHHHRSLFYGYVNNEGEIRVAHLHNLTIIGSYFQGPQGKLIFLDMDLENQTSGQLSVSGPAVINGAISYTLARVPGGEWTREVLVLQATFGISGKFKSNPTNEGSLLVSHSSVTYIRDSVYLSFGIEIETTEWWIWFMIVVGFLVALAMFIFYCYLSKTRHDYIELSR